MRDRPAAARPDRRITPADLSVVVCTYATARRPELEAAVASLLAQQARVGEIIVVVDHNDELLEYCRRTWPDLTVLASTGPRGLSAARDTGARAARGDVVAFLDDDAAAAPDWSARLADAFQDGVLGAGGFIEPAWPGDGPPSWWPTSFNWVVGCSYPGMPTTRAAVRNVFGANMSVRRDVLLGVGGFDARVGRIGAAATGCEETEMYIRAVAAHPGSVVVFEPAARVRHRVGPERVTWRYFVARCYGEGRSKAVVARLSDPRTALSSERGYVARTLPSACVRGLVSRDPRAGLAVPLGLVCTTAGYLAGRAAGGRAGRAADGRAGRRPGGAR